MPNNKKFITLDNLKKFAEELKNRGIAINSEDEGGDGEITKVVIPCFELPEDRDGDITLHQITFLKGNILPEEFNEEHVCPQLL
jgi:hypothetical protein